MANAYVGEIRIFAGNFAPLGWALCDGRVVSIAENSELFALLGTIYGGDGVRTFALPDLRGRALIHQVQGAGLSLYQPGESGGAESVAVTSAQLPRHGHAMSGSSAAGSSPNPGQTLAMGTTASGEPIYAPGPGTVDLAPQAITNTGGGQAHENRQPYLAVSYIIALNGIFPPRS
jgi:microcystin-dependent protein